MNRLIVIVVIGLVLAICVGAFIALAGPAGAPDPSPPAATQPSEVVPEIREPDPPPRVAPVVDPDQGARPENGEPGSVDPVAPSPASTLAEKLAATLEEPDAESARKAFLRLVPEMRDGLTLVESELVVATLVQLDDPELERRLLAFVDLYVDGTIRSYIRNREEPSVVNAMVRVEAAIADDNARLFLRETLLDEPDEDTKDLVRYLNALKILVCSISPALDEALARDVALARERVTGHGLDMSEFLADSLDCLPPERRRLYDQ